MLACEGALAVGFFEQVLQDSEIGVPLVELPDPCRAFAPEPIGSVGFAARPLGRLRGYDFDIVDGALHFGIRIQAPLIYPVVNSAIFKSQQSRGCSSPTCYGIPVKVAAKISRLDRVGAKHGWVHTGELPGWANA